MGAHGASVESVTSLRVYGSGNIYSILPPSGWRTASVYIMLIHNIAAFTLHVQVCNCFKHTRRHRNHSGPDSATSQTSFACCTHLLLHLFEEQWVDKKSLKCASALHAAADVSVGALCSNTRPALLFSPALSAPSRYDVSSLCMHATWLLFLPCLRAVLL